MTTSEAVTPAFKAIIDNALAVAKATVLVEEPVVEPAMLDLNSTDVQGLVLVDPLVVEGDAPPVVDGTQLPPPVYGAPRDMSLITGTVTTEQQVYLAGRLWLQGYSFPEISLHLRLSLDTIQKYILQIRDDLHQAQQAHITELTAERVAGLSMVKAAAWEQYGRSYTSKWLAIILKSEELTAKLQGVLNERVQHQVQGTIVHKLFDFDDKGYTAIEATAEVIG
jgi:hypothetical protein